MPNPSIGAQQRREFLPISKPTIGPAEIAEVSDALASGWITTGPRTADFESKFAEYVGVEHALAVSSATGGLHIGLMALGVGPGDEVITTSMTWAATTNMIEILGARPVFVDIDPGTLQIDESLVEQAVTERTKGILPVHFAGAPCNLRALHKIAKRHGLWVFEDAAHAVGTHCGGSQVGADSRLSVFSFHPIKNMTTIEGGMLTTEDQDLAERLARLRFHGLGKTAWNRYTEGGSPQVEIVEPGFKYNMTDIQAAVGLHQLAQVDDFNQRRAELAELYNELLADVEEIERPKSPLYDHRHSWHLYVIKVLDNPVGLDRDGFMAAMRTRQIGTAIHFRAVHTQPYYARKYPEVLGRLSNTEWASDRICSLPLFPSMVEEDIKDVANAIKDAFAHTRA